MWHSRAATSIKADWIACSIRATASSFPARYVAEDNLVPVDHAPLPLRLRVALGRRLDHADTSVTTDESHAGQRTRFQVPQEAAPPLEGEHLGGEVRSWRSSMVPRGGFPASRRRGGAAAVVACREGARGVQVPLPGLLSATERARLVSFA